MVGTAWLCLVQRGRGGGVAELDIVVGSISTAGLGSLAVAAAAGAAGGDSTGE
jgi:hypothetical protein